MTKYLKASKLTDILEKQGISDYEMKPNDLEVTINYKKGFDALLREFKIKDAKVPNLGEYSPYGSDHYAFFEYKGWTFYGNIIRKDAAPSKLVHKKMTVETKKRKK